MNAQQQVVRRRVKKGYTAPVDSQWYKQWSLVSLFQMLCTVYNLNRRYIYIICVVILHQCGSCLSIALRNTYDKYLFLIFVEKHWSD